MTSAGIVTTPKVLTLLTDDFATVPEAAALVGRPKMTLYRWSRNGKLITVILGGKKLVPKSEIERLQKKGGTAL